MLDWADRVVPYRRAVYIAARILAVLLAAAVVLQHGNWTLTQDFHGPFAGDGEGGAHYAVAIGTAIPFLAIPSPLPASERAPGEGSPVRLWVNGRNWSPPDGPEPSIVQGTLAGISGLSRVLQFTLPPGVANDAATLVTVEYHIKPHRSVYEAIAYLAALIGAIAGLIAYRRRECAWLRAAAAGLPRLTPLLWGLSFGLIGASVLYAATVAYGIAAGDALPTTTALRLSPAAGLVSALAPAIPILVLAFAGLGAALGWAAWLGFVPADKVRGLDAAQTRLWRVWGLPALLCLLVFMQSSGGWSGFIRPVDYNYASLAGLVPHSDAAGYFKDTMHLAYFGEWEALGARRPMAQAFRQVLTLAADYSLARSLLIQAGLMALALYLAAAAMVRWRGIWAGIGFAGFALTIARPYLTTPLTEPLGYIWALFALIFFIEAIRLRSLPHALVALAGLTVAECMRMGAVFVIPLLVLWIGAVFARTFASRIRAMGIACAVVVAILAANSALEHLYGTPGITTGDNFSQIACGLALGTNWTGCFKAYPAEIARLSDERAISAFLFAKAWENFLAHPGVLLALMWRNVLFLLRGLGGFMLAGYIPLFSIAAAEALLLFLPLLGGMVCLWRRNSATERLFWIAILVGIPLSAAIIMASDGWRTLLVTHPFVAAFLATGFAAPTTGTDASKPPPSWRWQGGAAALTLSLALLMTGPALAHALGMRELRAHPAISPQRDDEEIVTGGTRMSGFLVIPDAAVRPRAIPCLHASEFAKLIRWLQLETDFGPFLDDALKRVPFAFVTAARLDGPNGANIYVAPAGVLEHRDVWAWRFTIDPAAQRERHWRIEDVSAAEPLP